MKFAQLKASPARWSNALSDSGVIKKLLTAYYGHSYSGIQGKKQLLCRMIEKYNEHYGQSECLLVRAPARINLMGRHIDSQGGHCNYIAIPPDLFILASPRDDTNIFLDNIEPKLYPHRRFDLRELLPETTTSWQQILSITARKTQKGDWVAYVKAIIARFLLEYPRVRFKGMTLLVGGDIPVAGGLSSSSALVVAVAEALVIINGLDIEEAEFVRLCGESEWYVGTRGGFGDHAAIKCAQKGMVTHMAFSPFRILTRVAFPEEYRVLGAHSSIFAFKSASAQTIFNQKLECYSIGKRLIFDQITETKHSFKNLLDIVTAGYSTEALYRLLLTLPATLLQDKNKKPDSNLVRGVVLFGLAEEARSLNWIRLLQNNRMEQLGMLMNISHDGDRVVKKLSEASNIPWILNYDDGILLDLAQRARKRDHTAELYWQPGAYRCSVEAIDGMVDLVSACPGVLGAQLSGAGLGGCMMVLVHRDSYGDVQNTMVKKYYIPQKLKQEIFECLPVAGSGPVHLQ
ncbi:hypothetical protein JW935_08420 [candidate division KSB1 bacterium]|nr:hypothetical protein [candidate division KSB1 bacterium]